MPKPTIPTDPDLLENFRKTLALNGQVVAVGDGRLYVAFDGRVYIDQPSDVVVDAGDYFEFIEQVRTGLFPRVTEADNLTKRTHDLMRRHFANASRYERGGNDEGARYQRYVGNMLHALLVGQVGTTICPESD